MRPEKTRIKLACGDRNSGTEQGNERILRDLDLIGDDMPGSYSCSYASCIIYGTVYSIMHCILA